MDVAAADDAHDHVRDGGDVGEACRCAGNDDGDGDGLMRIVVGDGIWFNRCDSV